MGRLVDADDLVGPSAIANRLGVGYAAVSSWQKRHPDFPERVATVGGTPVFLFSEVDAWNTERLAGRRVAREKRIKALEDELARLRAEEQEE